MKIRKTVFLSLVIVGLGTACFRALFGSLSVVDLGIGAITTLAFAELLLLEGV